MKKENLYDEIMQLCIEQLTTANKKGGLYKARYTKNDPKDEKSYNITITEEQAKKHIINLEEAFPFNDNSFDLAFCFFTLEHIENIEKFFNETYRIL